MRKGLSGWVLWLMLAGLPACGLMGSSIPDPVHHELADLQIQIDAPKAWTIEEDPKLHRMYLYAGKSGDRDHGLMIQRLGAKIGWEKHAGRFKDKQDIMLDKIVDEGPHELGTGGLRYETRREVEGKPAVVKHMYYVQGSEWTWLMTLSAPQDKFNKSLFEHVAKTFKPPGSGG
ncbi:MAG: hypothetical protein ACI9MC_000975 [Kiritimatiellia bacterium]|jgi:hypothetical protein